MTQVEARKLGSSEAQKLGSSEARSSEARSSEARSSEARSSEARSSEAWKLRSSEAQKLEARSSEARKLKARSSNPSFHEVVHGNWRTWSDNTSTITENHPLQALKSMEVPHPEADLDINSRLNLLVFSISLLISPPFPRTSFPLLFFSSHHSPRPAFLSSALTSNAHGDHKARHMFHDLQTKKDEGRNLPMVDVIDGGVLEKWCRSSIPSSCSHWLVRTSDKHKTFKPKYPQTQLTAKAPYRAHAVFVIYAPRPQKRGGHLRVTLANVS
ncbi:hypothetical protein FB446DRAFT_785495 [Lentinula raphanica]|nr:hypothetical protein FB446DRAFT_785495 [Lentinula raphanica]